MQKLRFPPPKTFFTCFFIAFFGTVPNSYQSVLNQPATVIKAFVNDSYYKHYGEILSSGELSGLWGFICSALCLGAVVGAAIFNQVAERFGRKNGALVFNSIVVTIGAIIQAASKFANSFEMLIIGRFISGISVSLCIVCSVYLSESAPDYCRGLCSVMVSLFFGFWAMMVTVIGLPSILGSEDLWPYLMGYGIPFAVGSIILSRFIPESPKYLLLRKKNEKEAIKSIQHFHGPNVDIDRILEEFRKEEQLAQSEREYSYKEIFREKHLRRAFWICVMTYSSTAYVGIDVVYQYSNDILTSIGLNDQNSAIAVILTQIPAVCSSLFALMLVEKLGRRKLMFLALSVAILGFILFLASNYWTYLALVGLILVFSSHHGGASPERDIVAGDVCPQGIRAKAAGSANLCSFTLSFFIVLAFPPLEDILGTYVFIILMVVCLLAFVWFWKFMPEGTQKPVDETLQHLLETHHLMATDDFPEPDQQEVF